MIDTYPIGTRVQIATHPDLGRASGQAGTVDAPYITEDHRVVVLDGTGERWGMHVNWLTAITTEDS